MGVEAATELLKGLGFEVTRTKESDTYLGLGFGVARGSDPGSGEEGCPEGLHDHAIPGRLTT